MTRLAIGKKRAQTKQQEDDPIIEEIFLWIQQPYCVYAPDKENRCCRYQGQGNNNEKHLLFSGLCRAVGLAEVYRRSVCEIIEDKKHAHAKEDKPCAL